MGNDAAGARSAVHKCIDLAPAYAAAHLLLAQIALTQDNFSMASQSLEQAVSSDFDLAKTSVAYKIIKAKVHFALDQHDEALEVL